MRRLIVSVMIMAVAMTAEAKEKPNVILIMADDVGAEGIGSYGNPYISTPSIDRLASEEKRLLQTLAVIGKEFSLGLVVEA